MNDDDKKAIGNTVCDLDGSIATLDAMIGAFCGDCYPKFDRGAAVSAMMLLRDSIDRANDRIRELS